MRGAPAAAGRYVRAAPSPRGEARPRRVGHEPYARGAAPPTHRRHRRPDPARTAGLRRAGRAALPQLELADLALDSPVGAPRIQGPPASHGPRLPPQGEPSNARAA